MVCFRTVPDFEQCRSRLRKEHGNFRESDLLFMGKVEDHFTTHVQRCIHMFSFFLCGVFRAAP